MAAATSTNTVNQELLQAIAQLFLKLVPAEDLEANKREINKAFKALNGGNDLLRVAKKQKDKDAPKKAKTAFMYFSAEQGPVIVAKDAALKSDVTARAKRLGEMWQKTSEDDRKKYFVQAEADKVRYQTELAAYRKATGQDAPTSAAPKKAKASAASGAGDAPAQSAAPKAVKKAAAPAASDAAKVDVPVVKAPVAKAAPKASKK